MSILLRWSDNWLGFWTPSVGPATHGYLSQGQGAWSKHAGENCSVYYSKMLAPPCPLHIRINPHWTARGRWMPEGFLGLEKAAKQPGSKSSTVAYFLQTHIQSWCSSACYFDVSKKQGETNPKEKHEGKGWILTYGKSLGTPYILYLRISPAPCLESSSVLHW